MITDRPRVYFCARNLPQLNSNELRCWSYTVSTKTYVKLFSLTLSLRLSLANWSKLRKAKRRKPNSIGGPGPKAKPKAPSPIQLRRRQSQLRAPEVNSRNACGPCEPRPGRRPRAHSLYTILYHYTKLVLRADPESPDPKHDPKRSMPQALKHMPFR